MNRNLIISDIEDICRQSGSKKTAVIENGEIKGAGESEADFHGICGELEITNTGKNMLLSGRVKAYAKAVCSRCLEEFSLEVSAEITEKFFRRDKTSSGGSLKKEKRQEEKSGVKEDEFSYSGFKLDMTEAIRQNLVVNMPFAAVCSESCKGLCSECGGSLNNGQCTCRE
ncbi:MAG: DUF177 domain-containing protein [bacterium]|nr:DUF177 domain-containing protein [bacterium]